MAAESANERMRAARERLGLTPEQVANQIGLNAPWYYDLEAYPDEVFSTISLEHLRLLGRALALEPATILVGDASQPAAPKTFADIAEGLRRQMAADGLDAKAFGDRVGWGIDNVLVDPNELWKFNVAGLRDVCAAAGIDWLAVLPGLR